MFDYIFSEFGGAAAIISALFAFLGGIATLRISQKELKALEKKLHEDHARFDRKMEQYTSCIKPVTVIVGKLLYKTAQVSDLATYESERMEAIAQLGFFASSSAVEQYMLLIDELNGSIKKEEDNYYIDKANFQLVARKTLSFLNVARADLGVAVKDENSVSYEFNRKSKA
ncbi:hypothetical protein Q6U59_004651 [Vibrio parahaemolyticus]|uniref:hypothetical protein n=1 Tax=Vibrio parahaemolyticus TaxID=670 RepID=UPI001303DD66|nr:hypothetical protein [Vibrio parahaemolyticus]ELA7843092.1 hypothetical protein [Vibrio parahaemolyticus]